MEPAGFNHKKVYAKGLIDGLAMAGLDPIKTLQQRKETGMNLSQFQAKMSGQTSLAQKVYEYVPIETPWSLHEITVALGRAGVRQSKDYIEGCLKTLADSKLIRYTEGKYIRVSIKDRAEGATDTTEYATKPPKDEEQNVVELRPADPPSQSTIDLMAGIAAKARNISQAVADLAKDIEDAALEIEQAAAKSQEQLDQLRQLKSILRSIA